MIVSCAAYQNGAKLADIAKEAIGEYGKRSDCWEWGYPIAVGLMVGLDAFLWVRFRRTGWL